MPLSEHEERVLAEIERQLQADDPRFLERTRRVDRGSRALRLRIAVAGFVVGLVCLLAVTFHLVLGLAGFALMFSSVVVAARALREVGAPGDLGARVRRVLGGGDPPR